MKNTSKIFIFIALILLVITMPFGCAQPGESGGQQDEQDDEMIINFPGFNAFDCVQYGGWVYFDDPDDYYQIKRIRVDAESMAEAKVFRENASIELLVENYLLINDFSSERESLVVFKLDDGQKQAAKIENYYRAAQKKDQFIYFLTMDNSQFVKLGRLNLESLEAEYINCDKSISDFVLTESGVWYEASAEPYTACELYLCGYSDFESGGRLVCTVNQPEGADVSRSWFGFSAVGGSTYYYLAYESTADQLFCVKADGSVSEVSSGLNKISDLKAYNGRIYVTGSAAEGDEAQTVAVISGGGKPALISPAEAEKILNGGAPMVDFSANYSGTITLADGTVYPIPDDQLHPVCSYFIYDGAAWIMRYYEASFTIINLADGSLSYLK